jgi:tetratricopeptide (TPR) repeat protein
LARNPDTSEEGLDRLRAAVRANPRSTTFVALAHRLCENGRAAEAEDVCREGLAQHPGLVTAQVALGRALLDRGRLREAQEVLIAAAKANPDHGDAFRWLGETVIRRGDLPRARVLLEYAEELSPNDRRVGELLVEAGGSPTFRSPRPRTDFEHTRVANARALAERMHEEPDALEVTRVGPLVGDEPTVVDGAAALQAWAVRPAPEPQTPPPVEIRVERSPAQAAPAAAEAQPFEDEVLWPTDPEPVVRAPAARAASRAVSTLGGGTGTLEGRHRHAVSPADARLARTRTTVLVVGAVVVAGVIAAAVIATRRAGPVQPGRELLGGEVSIGSLSTLMRARDQGRQLLARQPADADGRAALAFTDALLTRDYGLPFRQEAEETLAQLGATPSGPPARLAVVQSARALLALGAGDLPEAQRRAEQAIALAPDGKAALLASARVRIQAGDLPAAREQLERLLARAPDFAPAVLDWAAVWIDLGDPSAAAQSLRAQLERTPQHTRARLLLAEAQRALGERPSDPELVEPCRGEETRQSPTIRAGCALAMAAEARLAGDRASAVKNARAAAAEAPDDARLLASAALSLAVLGEIDAGAEALARARKLAAPQLPALVWADVALRLGRRQPVAADPVLASASGPERRLVAARVALARGGIAELAAAMRALPVAVVLFDPDLRALAFLGREGAGARGERAELDKRAEHGDPLAAYVLGRLAERSADNRQAVRRLDRSLWGHGDACDAAARLRALRPTEATARLLRELRTHNTQCDPTRI